MQTPRWEDSFLIVSLGAIFFPFALHHNYLDLTVRLQTMLAAGGLQIPAFVVGSLIFFMAILIFQVVYYTMVRAEARYLKIDKVTLLPLLGYGFIPIILAGYLSVHLEFFVKDAWRLVLILQETMGFQASYENIRLISRDSTFVLQSLTVLGGLLASMYATYRIIDRLQEGESVTSRMLILPFGFLVSLSLLFLFIL